MLKNCRKRINLPRKNSISHGGPPSFLSLSYVAETDGDFISVTKVQDWVFRRNKKASFMFGISSSL